MEILIFYYFTIILKKGERALYADYSIAVRKDTHVVYVEIMPLDMLT